MHLTVETVTAGLMAGAAGAYGCCSWLMAHGSLDASVEQPPVLHTESERPEELGVAAGAHGWSCCVWLVGCLGRWLIGSSAPSFVVVFVTLHPRAAGAATGPLLDQRSPAKDP